jgi:hypothetical protein
LRVERHHAASQLAGGIDNFSFQHLAKSVRMVVRDEEANDHNPKSQFNERVRD